jgi:phosphatidylserine decarboxylase
LYGWLHKLPWSRCRIRPFVGRYNIDMTESRRGIEAFASFNDFFVREIDLARRPVNPDPATCVSPIDGRLVAYQKIDAAQEFKVKRSTFDLARLLGDASLAAQYHGGSMVVSRIYLPDYHHVHFPDSGIPGEARPIKGKYWAVSPHSRRWSIPFYSENHRVLTNLDSEHFGPVAIVEIGAFTVGSIQQRYQPDKQVAKGDHKGYFELGGSTVVVLFEKGRIRLAEDLCANTQAGLETFVRMGESIGDVPSNRNVSHEK